MLHAPFNSSYAEASVANRVRRAASARVHGMLRWLAVLCLLAHLLTSEQAAGQSTTSNIGSEEDRWFLGYSGFRMLLEERGLSVRRDLSRTLARPTESVVLLFGDLSATSIEDWRRYRRYVTQGGTLLIASETAFTLPGVSTFTPGPVSSNIRADSYQGFPDCLTLTKLNPTHPMTTGLRQIIVNRSGWLSKPEDDSLSWEVIASLPDRCFPIAARGKPMLLAGVDPVKDRGVLILCADQSLFSDGMLWHGDNSILAIQTSDLLCRGQRKWLTVIDNGKMLASYRESPQQAQVPPMPMPPMPQIPPQLPLNVEPPVPDLETALKIANAVVDEVQESNLVNETLRDRPRNMRPIAWLRTIALVLFILITLFVLWRLTQNSSILPPIRHLRFMQSMYGVNSAQQLKSNEFGSAVEVLARDLCREITGSPFETHWLQLLSDGKASKLPPLSRSLRKGLTELLGIATRGCRIHISRRKFEKIGQTIQQLRTMHQTRPFLKPDAASPLSPAISAIPVGR